MKKRKSPVFFGIYRVWCVIKGQEYSYIGYSKKIPLNVNSIKDLNDFFKKIDLYNNFQYEWNINEDKLSLSNNKKEAIKTVSELLKNNKFPSQKGVGLKFFLLMIVYDLDINKDIHIEILEKFEETLLNQDVQISKKTPFIEKYRSYEFGFNSIHYEDIYTSKSKMEQPYLEYKSEENQWKLKNKLQSEFKNNGSDFSKNKFAPWLYCQLFKENEPEFVVWDCFWKEFKKKFNLKISKI